MAGRCLTGRAELLRIVLDQADEDAARLALLLGFEPERETPKKPKPPPVDPENILITDGKTELATVEVKTGTHRPVPFLMPVKFERFAREALPGPPPPPLQTAPGAMPAWRERPTGPPPWPPLRSWVSLLGLLRSLLTPSTDGPEIDLDRAIQHVAECRVLRRPPRQRTRSWSRHCVVVLDRNRRLVPLWTDQIMVLKALSRSAPHMTVTPVVREPGTGTFRSMDGDGTDVVEPVRDGTPWLVLGDLGAITGEGPALWAALARAVDPGCAIAISPVPRDHLAPDLRALWRVAPWEEPLSVSDGFDRRDLARKLLVCLSPAFCFTPGMLRAMRRIVLPEADALVECLAWNDPAVECHASHMTTLAPEAVAALRTAFASDVLTDVERKKALSVIRAWRTGESMALVGEDFWFPEVMNLSAAVRERCLPNPGDLNDARRYFEDLDRRRGGDGEPLGLQTRAWLSQVGACAPKAFEQEAAFRNVVWSVKAMEKTYTPPPGVLPDVGLPAVGRVAMCHAGSDLAFSVDQSPSGSPVIALDSEDGVIDVSSDLFGNRRSEVDRLFPWRGGPDEQDPLPPNQARRRVAAGRGADLSLDQIGPRGEDAEYWLRLDQALADDLSWASNTGRDRYGLWAEFRIDDVTQRLRWIPPGWFVMGSPEDEPGRFGDEGSQHEVTLDQGFWLFDAPCTQALWQAVMGESLSLFQSPDRPVGAVSWNSVQTFLKRINERIPGLDLTLPSEAQWEYACRANADPPSNLDAVAWYGANSDGGTHPVGQKQPNAWGLHDMLGNVLEWCADHWHGTYEGAPVDGSAWLDHAADTGALRVLRGGSWLNPARIVRAAIRDRAPAGARSSSFGFRCSQGPVSSSTGRAEPLPPGQGRQAEHRPAPAGGGEAQDQGVLRVGEGRGRDALRLPATPALVIRTDREQVILEQCTLRDYPWAEAMGRDRFGLWARFAVDPGEGKPVTQRLRWIPPGWFVMGSPEDEPGRYEDEGPQHEVTLEKGFWLFDTPCTQALWRAVMGENPSQFKSPDRPVEQVSWDDVQTFLQRINERIPGLDLTLPSEAQWEYACRAGTQTALYTGGIEILGERNAPALDPIAWYGGNSGRHFDLENGLDTSDWPEKQYPDTKAGTHFVGQKQPNAWGLHDMLGNVWEWCVDPWHKTHEGAPMDGTAWLEDAADTGASRILRGGSWYGHARLVRAAVRSRRHPDVRDLNVGFRCSQVQS